VLRALVGYAFPAYASVKVMKLSPEHSEESEDELVQWLGDWLIFGLIHIAECGLFAVGVGSFIPLYNEVSRTFIVSP